MKTADTVSLLPAEVGAEELLADLVALADRLTLIEHDAATRTLTALEELQVAKAKAGLYAQLGTAAADLADWYYNRGQADAGDAAQREMAAYNALWKTWQQAAEEARAVLTPCCQARVRATLASVRCSNCDRPVTPLRPCGVIA